MENVFKFPLPEAIIADCAHLIEAGTSRLKSESFISLPQKKNALILIGITKGSVLFSDEFSTIGAAQGSALLLPQYSYSIFAETDTDFIYFILGGSVAHALMEKTVKDGGRYFPNGAAVLSGELSKINHAQSLGILMNANSASLSAYAVLMKLYGKSSPQQHKNYPQLVSDALTIMRENFAFIYGIEDLAQQLSVSKNHLIRQFTKHVGVSPGKFLTAVRIEHAKLVMQSGETGLEAVAVASGFSDANYFCKVFKKETGMRPGEFLQSVPKTAPIPVRSSVYL